jgi:hypothetical protein
MPSAMKLPREMSPSQFAVKIGPEELGHIVTLRKNLDHMGVLARFADQYIKLGWPLAALEAHTGANLGLDFTLPRQAWSKGLMDGSLKGHEVNLAVRTDASSRLFAVKVDAALGPQVLDRFGEWRSRWVALAGTTWEQHFYLLPSTWRLPTFSDSYIEVLGEGGLALAPPSLEPGSEDTWRWLRAPWEGSPSPPPAGLCCFLKHHGLISTARLLREPQLPSWKEVFARISPHRTLLSALLAPQASPARYYQEIITQALKAGCREPEMLMALLWHAPHGDAARRPERWRHMFRVVAEIARIFSSGSTSPTQASRDPGWEKTSQRTLLHHLEKLTARTRELERQLATLQPAANLSGSQADGWASQCAADPKDSIPFWPEWLALIQRPSLDNQEVKEFQGAVANFLLENRELANDNGKLQLVLYCYANYVKINPGYSGLPHQERLARAGEMARSFLTSPVF